MSTTFQNIDEFIAQYPCAEEIASTRKWSRWVSGEYDEDGHATDDCTFCQFCGDGWLDFCCSNTSCKYGPPDDDDEGEEEV